MTQTTTPPTCSHNHTGVINTNAANVSSTASDFILTPPEVFPYKEQQLTARARLTEQMAARIIMLDSAMGTHIQTFKL